RGFAAESLTFLQLKRTHTLHHLLVSSTTHSMISLTDRSRAIHNICISLALITASACASTTSARTGPATAPASDPRVGLKPGKYDAGEAIWNLRVVSKTPPPAAFEGKINSDLAFLGRYVIQGNFNGYQVWDISDPAHPNVKTAYVCPASQSDVSVYGNLLFVSGE